MWRVWKHVLLCVSMLCGLAPAQYKGEGPLKVGGPSNSPLNVIGPLGIRSIDLASNSLLGPRAAYVAAIVTTPGGPSLVSGHYDFSTALWTPNNDFAALGGPGLYRVTVSDDTRVTLVVTTAGPTVVQAGVRSSAGAPFVSSAQITLGPGCDPKSVEVTGDSPPYRVSYLCGNVLTTCDWDGFSAALTGCSSRVLAAIRPGSLYDEPLEVGRLDSGLCGPNCREDWALTLGLRPGGGQDLYYESLTGHANFAIPSISSPTQQFSDITTFGGRVFLPDAATGQLLELDLAWANSALFPVAQTSNVHIRTYLPPNTPVPSQVFFMAGLPFPAGLPVSGVVGSLALNPVIAIPTVYTGFGPTLTLTVAAGTFPAGVPFEFQLAYFDLFAPQLYLASSFWVEGF